MYSILRNGAFFAGGNRVKLISPMHDRGHFEPLWTARDQTDIGRMEAKMQIAKFGARKVDFFGGGIAGTYTCSTCGRKDRGASASAINNLCAPCDMNRRPYCIRGDRFD